MCTLTGTAELALHTDKQALESTSLTHQQDKARAATSLLYTHAPGASIRGAIILWHCYLSQSEDTVEACQGNGMQ